MKQLLVYVRTHKAELCAALGITIFAYLLFVTGFLLQSHGMRFPWVNPTDQVYAGRWFTPVVFWFNYSANVPVFTPVTAIVAYLSAIVLVLRLWQLELTGTRLVLLICSVSTFPMFTVVLYYNYASLQWPLSMLIGCAGLTLASRFEIWRVALGSLLVTVAMATNQTVLSTLAVVFIGCILSELRMRPSLEDFFSYEHRKHALAQGMAIVLGVVAYAVTLKILGTAETHATATLSAGQFTGRFLEVVGASIKHLVITQPDFQPFLKYLLLVTVALGAIVQCVQVAAANAFNWRTRVGSILVVLTMIVLFALATKAMYLVSSTSSFYTYRYNLGMAFFYAYFLSVLLNVLRGKYWQVLAMCLCIIVVFRFIQVDLLRQGVLHRGQTHDLAIANRILMRIESLPELDMDKPYVLVRVGDYPAFRRHGYNSLGHATDHRGADHMDRGFLTESWAAGSVMQFLGTRVNLKYASYNPSFREDIVDARKIIEQDGRMPWPHSSSVFIRDDKIVVYLH